MLIEAVLEYNEGGNLVYARNFPGAFTRGKTRDEAFGKLKKEVASYCSWVTGLKQDVELAEIIVVQEEKSNLRICDADTEIIFATEIGSLSETEYLALKRLILKSAEDFEVLYASIPDKDISKIRARQTFYGELPRTAREMYEHTNNVTSYYLGEIAIPLINQVNMVGSRIKAIATIESSPSFLKNAIYQGAGGEIWSLKKVLRRFIWHDRNHAKAMYRMSTAIWGKDVVKNPFFFE